MSVEIHDRRRPDVQSPRPMVRLSGVSVTAGPAAAPLLHHITLDIHSGPPTLLIGPNGAGKTTLLRLLMGLADHTSGSLSIEPLQSGIRPRLAIVFQKPVMLRRSAADNVAIALAAARHSTSNTDITRLLEHVGLSSLSHRPARRLSGGEQQRLALARALARQPDILLLDEPTASLDPAQTKIVEDIVGRVAAAGVKVVMATHDLGQARRLAGDIVFLAGGSLIEQAPADRFFTQPQTVEARRFVAGDLII